MWGVGQQWRCDKDGQTDRSRGANAGNRKRVQALVSDRMTLKCHAALTLYCFFKTEKSVQCWSGAWQSPFLHMAKANFLPCQIVKGPILHNRTIFVKSFIQHGGTQTITQKTVHLDKFRNEYYCCYLETDIDLQTTQLSLSPMLMLMSLHMCELEHWRSRDQARLVVTNREVPVSQKVFLVLQLFTLLN